MMLQTSDTKTVTDKSSCVDRQVSLRNLGEKEAIVRMADARPESDVHGCIAIRIYDIPTTRALKTCPVSGSFSSASGACVGCASWRDCNHEPTVLPSHAFECHSKLVIGHPLGLTIAFSVTSCLVEVFEIFDSNERIIFLGKFDNLVSDLPTSCSSVVVLVSSEPSESLSGIPTSLVGMAHEFGAPEIDISLSVANILPKVELLENFALSTNHGCCCKPFDSNINTYDSIIIFLHFILFLESDMNSTMVDPEESSGVSLFQQCLISPMSPISGNRDGDSTIVGSNGYNRVAIFSGGKFPTSGDIIGYCNLSDLSTIVQNCYSIFEKVVGYLAMKSKPPNIFVEHALEFGSFDFDILRYNEGECFFISPFKLYQLLLLNFCRLKQVQCQRFNYFHPNKSISAVSTYMPFASAGKVILQFLPNLKVGASLEAGE